jgi:hypothetical protein
VPDKLITVYWTGPDHADPERVPGVHGEVPGLPNGDFETTRDHARDVVKAFPNHYSLEEPKRRSRRAEPAAAETPAEAKKE